MDEIKFDFTMNAGFYNAYDVYQALGSNRYTLGADKCTVQHAQSESDFIEEEEYDILINDPDYFVNEYFPKKSFPIFKLPKEEAYEAMKKSIQASVRCDMTSGLIMEKALNTYGIVPFLGPPARGFEDTDDLFGRPGPFYFSTIDTIFDYYRGMMGIFEDLTENREVLDKAIAVLSEYNMKRMPPMPPGVGGHPFPLCFAIYHCAPFLSPDDFEKYWFSTFKKIMLPWAEAGRKIYLKGEGSFAHTIEKYREMPKGSVIIQLDSDDPFEMKKKIGDHQPLMCGLKIGELHTLTIQQLKDKVKRLFDELAPGGGYLFYTDKPLLSPLDAKVEVVKEVWDFANEYSYGRS